MAMGVNVDALYLAVILMGFPTMRKQGREGWVITLVGVILVHTFAYQSVSNMGNVRQIVFESFQNSNRYSSYTIVRCLENIRLTLAATAACNNYFEKSRPIHTESS